MFQLGKYLLFRKLLWSLFFLSFLAAGAVVSSFANGDTETKILSKPPKNKAPDPDLATVIDKVEKRYKSLKDFQADFVQLARILSYPEDQRSEGKVYLKRDRLMRWDYSSPSKDQYFIQGDSVIFYNPDVKQARSINLAGKGGIRSPLVFFEGLKVAEPDYIISLNQEPAFDRTDRVIVQLTPRNREKTPLFRILLFVSKSDYQVKRVDQYDLHGNVTELYFNNVQVNKDISDAHFVFDPPKGVEVINQK